MVDLSFVASGISRWLLTASLSAVVFTLVPQQIDWIVLGVMLATLVVWGTSSLDWAIAGWRSLLMRDNQAIALIFVASLLGILFAFFICF